MSQKISKKELVDLIKEEVKKAIKIKSLNEQKSRIEKEIQLLKEVALLKENEGMDDDFERSLKEGMEYDKLNISGSIISKIDSYVTDIEVYYDMKVDRDIWEEEINLQLEWVPYLEIDEYGIRSLTPEKMRATGIVVLNNNETGEKMEFPIEYSGKQIEFKDKDVLPYYIKEAAIYLGESKLYLTFGS
jgi:hypothetical protein